MKRIYSNYSEDEFEQISKHAEAAGMTVSAFCKYAVLEKVTGTVENSPSHVVKELYQKLQIMEPEECFIVSDLFPEIWSSLSRSEKNTIAKQLAKYVRENSNVFVINNILPGKITQYKKIKQKN